MRMTKSKILSSQFKAPVWVEDMARKYAASALSVFTLHGNVMDYVAFEENGERQFLPLTEFLTSKFFERRSLILTYDLSSGIQCPTSEMRQEVERLVRAIDTVRGTSYLLDRGKDRPAEGLPKDPQKAIELIARMIRGRLIKDNPAADKSIGVVIKYAESVFPESEYGSVSERAASIALSELASDPNVLENDVTIVLVTEGLATLSKRVQSNPYNAIINIPLPDEKTREDYIKRVNSTATLDLTSDVVGVLSKHTSGLTLLNIRALLQEAKQGNVDFGRPDYIYKRKREMIEAECRGLLEFIQPKYKLDMVAVHTRAVEELKRDSQLVLKGHLDAVPMGYLITGPAGSGKSFLIKAFAGEVGIPCVELKNFRDKWVGATEQNLEKIITVLTGLAPVACIIDEADAYLGTREGDGDSGVSSRVFSRLTSYMGDTANRGKILWFLITNRPDLLAMDLKRQGRAEKHIPLFPPETEKDYEDLFQVFVKKLELKTQFSKLLGNPPEGTGLRIADVEQHSGADLEALLVRAKGMSLLAGEESMSANVFIDCLKDYVSPNYPQQEQYQILQAVAESTMKSLIPERWHLSPQELHSRIEALRPWV
jgi:ATP-dependent 26S proteasome regulatory subunit